MKTKKSSNKNFGILFFIVFALIGFWPIINSESIRIWSIIVSLIFLILGLTNSKILSPLNKTWIKFGEILGIIVAPIVMLAVFLLVVTPIGLFLKIIGKDLLRIKKNKKEKTYWISRKNIKSMNRQF